MIKITTIVFLGILFRPFIDSNIKWPTPTAERLYQCRTSGIKSGASLPANEQQYYCMNNCGRVYNSAYNMKRHAKTECGNEAKNFECTICMKRFRRKYHLQRHHASVHFSLPTSEAPSFAQNQPILY